MYGSFASTVCVEALDRVERALLEQSIRLDEPQRPGTQLCVLAVEGPRRAAHKQSERRPESEEHAADSEPDHPCGASRSVGRAPPGSRRSRTRRSRCLEPRVVDRRVDLEQCSVTELVAVESVLSRSACADECETTARFPSRVSSSSSPSERRRWSISADAVGTIRGAGPGEHVRPGEDGRPAPRPSRSTTSGCASKDARSREPPRRAATNGTRSRARANGRTTPST